MTQTIPLPDAPRTLSQLPGGLGLNATAALEPGEFIQHEVHTTVGEGAVLTDRRLLLVRAGFSAAGIGKIHAFALPDLQEVQFHDYPPIKKFKVITALPPSLAHELSVLDRAAELEGIAELLRLLSQDRPTRTFQSAEEALGPQRTKLPGQLGRAILATLRPDEEVLREIHSTGEGMVVTNERVLIVKGGSASQSLFGQKVKSYPFESITSIEVSAGAVFGRIQITVPGAKEGAGRSLMPMGTAQMENVVQINSAMLSAAREIANFIEGRMKDAKRPQQVVAPAAPAATGAAGLVEQLRQLGELRDAGVLTQAEFEAAKARILNL